MRYQYKDQQRIGLRRCTFLYGHRFIPFWRHIFFNEVKHIPSFLATSLSGSWKYLERSMLHGACTDGIEEKKSLPSTMSDGEFRAL